MPVSLARQIHFFILLSQQQDQEEAEELARRRLEADDRIARPISAQMFLENERDQLQWSQGSPEAADLERLRRRFPQIDKDLIHFMYTSENRSVENAASNLEELLANDQKYFSETSRAERERQFLEQAVEASRQVRPQDTRIHAAAAGPGSQTSSSLQGVARSSSRTSSDFQDVVVVGSSSRTSRNLQGAAGGSARRGGGHFCDELDENPWDAKDPMAAYSKYRANADTFRKQRDDSFRKAREAFQSQHREAANFYSQQGQEHDRKFRYYSELASAALIAAHSDAHSTDVLDLHYFKVDEAVTTLDLFLDHHIRGLVEADPLALTIITGRGVHSVRGRPVVKPAVIKRMQQRGIRFEEIKNNNGTLRLFVTKDSALSHHVASWRP